MIATSLPALSMESASAKVLISSTKATQDKAIERAQGGDPGAFAELYIQHKRRVFLICMRMVRDCSLAEDLTQDTFLQLHRKIASFRGDSAFATWLYRLTFNVVLMHLRRRPLPVISLDYAAIDIADETVKCAVGALDKRQVGVIDRLALERALDALSPGYRRIILLHDVHGFEHREIASMDGCTEGNSKSQLHKARRSLRVALKSQRVSIE